MTTTLSAHGGGAQPARIDTGGKVTGGAAMRVYGFDSEAAALAAGYVCEGGPAMSVALITDAQLASGEWKLDGDPFSAVIYTAPDSIPSEGGFAVPVYPVNGWGGAPAGDPIGDALRAAALAYWTMNESAGDARLDSVNSSILSENADGSSPGGPVASVSGLIGNAAKIIDNTSSVQLLANLATNISQSGEVSIWGWSKVNALSGTDQIITVLTFKIGSDVLGPMYFRRPNGTIYITAVALDANPGFPDIVPDAWYFTVVTYDFSNHAFALSVNNSAPVALSMGGNISGAITRVIFGFTNYINDTDFIIIDEWGIVSGILTSEQINYLYNSGAGRALYP